MVSHRSALAAVIGRARATMQTNDLLSVLQIQQQTGE